MILPDDVEAYQALMQAYVEGEDGGLPLEAVSWVGVEVQEEPNRAAVRHVSSSAGLQVSELGGIEEMRIEDRVAFVQLKAHVQENQLEIAIAEPVVRETMVAFDMIDRVEFKP